MEKKLTNGMATAGFVLSLTTLFFGWIPILGWIIWALGLIFSSIGLSKAKKVEGKGKGLAIAGLVISLVDLFLIIVLASAIVGILGMGAAASM